MNEPTEGCLVECAEYTGIIRFIEGNTLEIERFDAVEGGGRHYEGKDLWISKLENGFYRVSDRAGPPIKILPFSWKTYMELIK